MKALPLVYAAGDFVEQMIVQLKLALHDLCGSLIFDIQLWLVMNITFNNKLTLWCTHHM